METRVHAAKGGKEVQKNIHNSGSNFAGINSGNQLNLNSFNELKICKVLVIFTFVAKFGTPYKKEKFQQRRHLYFSSMLTPPPHNKINMD